MERESGGDSGGAGQGNAKEEEEEEERSEEISIGGLLLGHNHRDCAALCLWKIASNDAPLFERPEDAPPVSGRAAKRSAGW